MENKINIAELLKDCPKGMELDCTMYDGVEFMEVNTESDTIILRVGNKFIRSLNKYGQENNVDCAKCVIFPKGKTTWEGFQRPFKDGDILFVKGVFSWVLIYKESENKDDLYKYVAIPAHPNHTYITYDNNPLCCKKDISKIRLATEEEKHKLFQVIKDNGYKWNAETKALVKLPKFKIEKGKWYICIKDLLDRYANKAFCKGDTYYSPEDGYLIPINSNVPSKVEYCIDEYFRDWTIQDAKDGDVLAAYECLVLFRKLDGLNIKCYCTYHFMNNLRFYVDTLQNKDAFHPATEEEKQKLFDAINANGYKWNAETKTLVKLYKFKAGDIIRHKSNNEIYCKLGEYSEDLSAYYTSVGFLLTLKDLEHWELRPNKFDVTTLKPFDRVLVRGDDNKLWKIQFFERLNSVLKDTFVCMGGYRYHQCVPYEGNEHLLNTSNKPDDSYKTWK